ncbi:MAG: hypothetical protein FWD58_03125 [Firmicutes bacterium]|nr:hypothetical protein [Bacillota bacterium]
MDYLNIDGIEFKNGVSNGEVPEKFFNLLPTAVLPKTKIIKTTERSLGGTMCVDITGVKKNLTVTFDVLSNDEFIFIRDFLSFENIERLDPNGLEVTYFDSAKKMVESVLQPVTIQCFVDSVNYVPFIVEDEIKWRDVVIELVEI